MPLGPMRPDELRQAWAGHFRFRTAYRAGWMAVAAAVAFDRAPACSLLEYATEPFTSEIRSQGAPWEIRFPFSHACEKSHR
jgi:hypothetical protein